MEVRNLVALVTGAGSGIGRELAREFARNSMKVACCGRRFDRLRETVSLIEGEGGVAAAIPGDVTLVADVDRLVHATVERFGGLDLLFNNAGAFDAIGGSWEVDPEIWWRDVTTNLRGPMLTCRAAISVMMKRNRGVIINMSGGGASHPLAGGSGYASSKAAVLRFTETLARELEQVGSRVIVVAMGPGLVKTEMTQTQANTAAGRTWIPSTARSFAEGGMRPPQDCARSTMELLRWIDPSFNGRAFQVEADFEKLARQLPTPAARDALLLRLNGPPRRGILALAARLLRAVDAVRPRLRRGRASNGHRAAADYAPPTGSPPGRRHSPPDGTDGE
jgi:NAD(P)-dependent dehydrogenase (short-subunit alcohol dehydrogenase family)